MKHWVYPANTKYYDVVSAFTKETETFWPMSSNVEPEDGVFVYLGAPHKQILFMCKVIKINLEEKETLSQAEKYIKVQKGPTKKKKKKFMALKTIHSFEEDEKSLLSFSSLKQNGLKGSIMGPLCLENNLELFKYINSICEFQNLRD